MLNWGIISCFIPVHLPGQRLILMKTRTHWFIFNTMCKFIHFNLMKVPFKKKIPEITFFTMFVTWFWSFWAPDYFGPKLFSHFRYRHFGPLHLRTMFYLKKISQWSMKILFDTILIMNDLQKKNQYCMHVVSRNRVFHSRWWWYRTSDIYVYITIGVLYRMILGRHTNARW